MSTFTLTRTAPLVEAAAVAWGFTDSQWSALSGSERADYRDRVAHALYGNTEGN